MNARLLLLGLTVVACETPPVPAVAPPPPPVSSAPSASVAPVASAPVGDAAPPVDAGAPPVAVKSGPPAICGLLEAGTAAGPPTERDGVTRAVVISDVSAIWGDFEGGGGSTTIYPSGFYRFSYSAPLSGPGKKNGYYMVTNRAALQPMFDDLAALAVLTRTLKQPGHAISLSGLSTHTTVSIGRDDIEVGATITEPASQWVSVAEPPGLLRPGIVGHHLADLKVLHAFRYRAADCISTFDHREASQLAALLSALPENLNTLSQMKPFLVDAVARMNPDFTDARAALAKLIASAPDPGQTPGSNPMPLTPSAPAAVGEARLLPVTSTPPVSDADRVAASLRARFRACYNKGTPADLARTGKILVRATLDANGEVSSTTVAENQGFSADVAACCKRTVNRAQFAAPGGSGATVDIPFMLIPPPATH